MPDTVFKFTRCTNAYFVHWILSYLPIQHLPRINRNFSLIIDLLYGAILLSLVAIGTLSTDGLIIALAFFVVTPQFVRFAGGKGISGRKVGLLATTVALLLMVIWTQQGDPTLLAASTFAGAIVPVSSRFGIQAYAFYSVALGFFVSPFFIMIFFSAIALAVIVTKGWYLYVLRDHLTHVYEYALYKQYKFLYDGLKSLETTRQFLTARSLNDLLVAIYESILIRGLLSNPFVVPTIVGVAVVYPQLEVFTTPALTPWAMTGIALFVLISLYHLRFLGQPSRYLPYAFVPSVVLISEATDRLGRLYDALVVLSLLVGTATLVGHFVAYRRLNNQTEREAFDEMIGNLRSLEPGVVFTQPRHFGAEVAWKTEHTVADYVGERTHADGLAEHRRLYPNGSTYITNDIDWLRDRYDPDWTLFDTNAEFAEEELVPPDSDPVYRNNQFELYSWGAFDNK